VGLGTDGRRGGARPAAGLERGDEDELTGMPEYRERLADVCVGDRTVGAERDHDEVGKRVGVAEAAEQGDRLGKLPAAAGVGVEAFGGEAGEREDRGRVAEREGREVGPVPGWRLGRPDGAAGSVGRRGEDEGEGEREGEPAGVRGDDRAYSARMRWARGTAGGRLAAAIGLAGVLGLGGAGAGAGARAGAAAVAQGSRGAGASTLTVGVWPSPARLGHLAVVEIEERGARAGDRVLECVSTPSTGSGNPRCAQVVLGPGGRASTRFKARRLGGWSVSVVAGARRVTRPVEVVPGRVRMLATGDSEIQVLDGMLGAALGGRGIDVRSEAHISTGISKPFMFDWVKHAKSQAASVHPDITVMFVGANDGFPLPAASGAISYCCGEAWVAAFAKRTESMMSSYLRGGAGRVFWFTLPTPRNAAAQPIFRAINRAYAIAARSFRHGVELIDLVAVFTPGGRYRQVMFYGGRTVDVREPDGYHLSVSGDRIAASILVGRLRADGLA
jgi:hypothetical protein